MKRPTFETGITFLTGNHINTLIQKNSLNFILSTATKYINATTAMDVTVNVQIFRVTILCGLNFHGD